MQKAYFSLLALTLTITIGIGPKGTPLLLVLLALPAVWKLLTDRAEFVVPDKTVIGTLTGLVILAVASIAWSESPDMSQKTSGRLALVCVFALLSAACLMSLSANAARKLIDYLAVGWISGSCLALAVAVFYFLYVEQNIRLLDVSQARLDNLARQIAKSLLQAVVFLFPLLPAVRFRLGRFFLPFMAVFAGILFISDSQSSALAIIAGTAFFLLHKAAGQKTDELLLAGLAATFVLVAPLAALNRDFAVTGAASGTSINSTVSYEERSRIYNVYAEAAAEKPLFGHGFFKGRTNNGEAAPHNVQLQILFDLGAAGALAFLAVLFSLYRLAVTRLAGQTRHAVAGFAAAYLAGIAFNFVVWQPWLLATLAFGTILFILSGPKHQQP